RPSPSSPTGYPSAQSLLSAEDCVPQTVRPAVQLRVVRNQADKAWWRHHKREHRADHDHDGIHSWNRGGEVLSVGRLLLEGGQSASELRPEQFGGDTARLLSEGPICAIDMGLSMSCAARARPSTYVANAYSPSRPGC